jgi:uncharacterized SAM-binding protein YcdF (DUF218 family)
VLALIWPLAAWGLARFLIVRAELPHADAIAVLSGSATYYERSRSAAELWKSGRAPMVLLTNDNEQAGWSSSQQRNPFFHEHSAEVLRRAGVPPDKIELLPEPISGTYEEAVLLREYATTHHLQSLIVVTSAYHSRRALWTLRRVFEGTGISLGMEPVPTGQQTPSPALWWIHRRAWAWIPGEYVKAVYYWSVS